MLIPNLIVILITAILAVIVLYVTIKLFTKSIKQNDLEGKDTLISYVELVDGTTLHFNKMFKYSAAENGFVFVYTHNQFSIRYDISSDNNTFMYINGEKFKVKKIYHYD